MSINHIFLFFILLGFPLHTINGQNGYSYHIDQFKGGVSGDGFAPNAGFGGVGNLIVNIAPGSTIRKAYLFAGRHGNAQQTTVIFAGNNIVFDSTNQITLDFFSPYGGNSALHAVDVTQYILPVSTNYPIIIPQQSSNTYNRYTDFYLYVTYENNSMNKVTTTIYLNEIGFNNDIRNYTISSLNKINNSFDIGLALFTGYLCDTIEGENVFVNNNNIGLIGLPDINNGSCGGTKGSFFYENGILNGLRDDNADSFMKGADALANINNYVMNNDTLLSIRFETEYPNNNSNAIWAIFLTYTTPCDTFSTSAYAVQDTICYGDSVQLFASGGVQYSWFGVFGGLSDSAVTNPLASPPQTTTYICTITNDSGCVKTEHVKVYVIPPVDSIMVKPTICGEQTGKITAEFNGNYTFTLLDSNNQTVASNTTGIFSQLPQGTYILQSQNNQCTYYDTLSVGYVNQTTASFWRNPYQGKAPLTVEFGNQSQIATDFVWLFPNDTFYTPNLTYTFDTGGVYPVCLVAYNNYPHCSDTACYTFFVEENALLEVPNVFSPNGDGKNDFFTLQFFDAAGISAIQVDIFNRWGQTVHQFAWQNTPPVHLNVWNGTNANGEKLPEGTYFYTVTYTLNDKQLNQKGSVTLVR